MQGALAAVNCEVAYNRGSQQHRDDEPRNDVANQLTAVLPTLTAVPFSGNPLLGAALLRKLYVFAVMTRWMRDGILQRYFNALAQPQTSSDL
jgi:hypothetical protein